MTTTLRTGTAAAAAVPVAGGGSVVWAEGVRSFRESLARGRVPGEPGDLVGLLGELEALKGAICAVQADAALGLEAARREEERIAGVPARRRGRGVAAEVALARRESPHRGRQLLGLARELVTQLPHTAARLRDGTLSEYKAGLLVRETAALGPAHRGQVDAAVCAEAGKLAGVGTRELVARARRAAIERDPRSMVERAERAVAERRVSLRPAPAPEGAGMCYLTALLPLAQGVGAYATLTRDAQRLRGGGDPRTKAQLMADLLTTRLTATSDPTTNDTNATTEAGVPPGAGPGPVVPGPPAVPVAVSVMLSDAALLGGVDEEAAVLSAEGVAGQVIPARVARALVGQSLREGVGAWIRRLYATPGGELVAMTSRQRFFPAGLAEFLTLRDQGTCRMPYCDAPIRHADHVIPAAEDGQTTATGGQGLCEACNHTKQAPGWRQTPSAKEWNDTNATDDTDDTVGGGGGRHTVTTTTPTGHRYTSTAPPPGRVDTVPRTPGGGARRRTISAGLRSSTSGSPDAVP
ncbi:HNH endonuclease [Georgenia alba]|uniref:DUF222 domain-containing protein n=1 Tax=Georgenia alba TaxID=2233858 RepID=A0ABW2QBT9_9MICO